MPLTVHRNKPRRQQAGVLAGDRRSKSAPEAQSRTARRMRLARILVVLFLASAVMLFGHALLARGQGTNDAVPAATPGEDVVVDVRVVGNETLPLRKISPLIRTRKGRKFDSELIEEDVRRMTRSGFFADVRPFYRRVGGGRVVIFEVVERPRVEYIKFVGAEAVAKKVLRKEIDLKEDDSLDPYMVAEARNRIEELYHKRGFDKVQVTVVEGSKLDDRGVVFLINEGAKKRILWTNFVGNTIASDSRLRTQIKSSPGFLWIFGGEVDREKIDADVDRLVAYYRGLGFLRARVGRELSHDLSRNWLTLTFVIDEGPRFKVRDVKVVGNKVIDTDEIRGKLRLQSDLDFNEMAMKSDVKNIEEQYGSLGYVFAAVKPNLRYLEDEPKVDLVYEIEEGDRYRVGRINVEINGEYPHTKITTVLNRLSFKPGDIVDVRELRASETRLRRSELFLVDPMSGKVPKIVFSPPELDANRGMLARQPSKSSDDDDRGRTDDRYGSRGSSYRGQSPDSGSARSDSRGQPQRWTVWSPPTSHRYAEPYVDLTIRADGTATITNQGATGVAPAPSAGQAQPPYEPTRTSPGRPTVVRYQSPARSTPTLPSQWEQFNDGGQATTAPYPSTTQPATTPGGYPSTSYPSGPTQAPPYPTAGSFQPTYTPPNYPAPNSTNPNYTAPNYTAPDYSGPSYPAPTRPTPATPNPAVGNQYPPDPIQSGGQGMFAPPRDEILPEVGPVFGEYPGVMGNALQPPTRDLDMDILLNETRTGRFMFGVGVNSDAGLMGNIVIDERNFDIMRFPSSWEDVRNATAWRGAGQRLRLEAVPGTEVQRYMATFQEPYLLNSEFVALAQRVLLRPLLS
jgi:outer membrane protein insertion porin family